jgi:hypothetical protein
MKYQYLINIFIIYFFFNFILCENDENDKLMSEDNSNLKASLKEKSSYFKDSGSNLKKNIQNKGSKFKNKSKQKMSLSRNKIGNDMEKESTNDDLDNGQNNVNPLHENNKGVYFIRCIFL